MCLKKYALHKQKNPFLPAFDSPVRPKGSQYSIPPAEAETIVGTVSQLASLRFSLQSTCSASVLGSNSKAFTYRAH